MEWPGHFGEQAKFKKVKYWVSIWPSNSTVRLSQEKWKCMYTKNVNMNIQQRLIHHRQRIEAPKCCSHDEWISKMWWIHRVEFHAAREVNEVLTHVAVDEHRKQRVNRRHKNSHIVLYTNSPIGQNRWVHTESKLTTASLYIQGTWGGLRSFLRLQKYPENNCVGNYCGGLSGLCIAWSTCETPSNGRGPVSDTLAVFWEPIFHTGLLFPGFIWEEELNPTSTWYAMLCWHPWDGFLFLTKTKRVDENRVEMGKRLGEKRGEIVIMM